MTALAARLARWVADLRFTDLPEPVRRDVDRAVVDTLGVAVAGAAHPLFRKLRDSASPGPCAVAGGGTASPAEAAFLNGVAAHAWDFDDTSYCGILHGSAVVFPAVLAAVEEADGDDETLAAAFAAGSEVVYFLGDALTASHYDAGWWSTVTIGLVGATAGAARAIGLDARRTSHALGLAAAAAGGGQSVFGTDAKPVLVGEAARRAVGFARLAAAGVTAPDRAFEAPGGFFALLGDGAPRAVPLPGEAWRIHDPGVLIKTSPVCSAAHGVIEAVASAVGESGASPDEIARIDCEVTDLVHRSLRFDRPGSPQEAQFSLPFAAACAALHGRVALEDLDPVRIHSPEVLRLMELVTSRVVPGLEEPGLEGAGSLEGARVIVTLASGATLYASCPVALGMPARPLGDEELLAKFRACLEFAEVGVPELTAWDRSAVRPYRRFAATVFRPARPAAVAR